jgi:putative endopeptidase
MDQAAIEAAGTAPLKPYLARRSPRRRPATSSSTCSRSPASSPVDRSSTPTSRIPTIIRPIAGQAGSACPTANIISDGAQDTTLPRRLSRLYRQDQKLADAGGEAAADRIIALETAIAKAQWTPRAKPRHRQDLQSDDARASWSSWRRSSTGTAALAKAGLGGTASRSSSREPSAVAGAGKILASDAAVDLEGMARLPLRFGPRAIPAQGAFDDARFNFYSKTAARR